MEPAIVSSWHELGSRPVRTLDAGAPLSGAADLVVVPGLGALGYLLPLVRACSGWTRVRLLDVPGFGQRATARCPARLTEVAGVVAEWLESVPDRPVWLLGHSTGAQVALRAALCVPQRVDAVVLAGPTFPPATRRWPSLLGSVARTLPHEALAEVRATFPDYLRGRSRVLTLLRSALDDEPERLVGELTCPVVVMRGERDAVSPAAWCGRLAREAARGQVLAVPGAHNFTFTAPGAASVALRGALEALAGTAVSG